MNSYSTGPGRWPRGGGALVLLLGALCQAIGRADVPPLPADMQAKVNKAIDKGVSALLSSMNPWGHWAPEKNHLVGYSALPGLTLLECGVAAQGPKSAKGGGFCPPNGTRPQGNL